MLQRGRSIWSRIVKHCVLSLSHVAKAYKTREPGPYWPETGQAQITSKVSLELLVWCKKAGIS